MKKNPEAEYAVQEITMITRLMDSQFRIPGTNIRFGLDGLVGLIPGVGDISSLAISGYLLIRMMQFGASGHVLARMLLNVMIDAVIGMVPFLGDIFDFAFKANTRNLQLMEKHFTQEKYQGGAWKIVVPILLIMLLLLTAIVWAFMSIVNLF